ncbi:MAG: peptidoglycan DD-metalloendopeptidase family protein [Candidatus Promineifilaceae bacterium]|nr:peptidoglycan DD-metalloendopeptidase family protein [Candidatus Promineifilaceae bacterium]
MVQTPSARRNIPRWRLALPFLLLLLAGCAHPASLGNGRSALAPTAVDTAVVPTVALEPTALATGATAWPNPTATAAPLDPTQSVSTLGATSAEPAQAGVEPPATAPAWADGGLRPAQAVQERLPDAQPTTPADWRPPPLEVPHALIPDDHYYLARPLASDARNYDLRWYPYGISPMLSAAQPYRVHHGVDFPNDTGTPIFAASSGTVVHAGPLPSPRDGVNYYGNTVVILHDWDWQDQPVYTLYAHTLELFVEPGDYVYQGQLIAGVGASGEVSGPHLHLEVRVGENHYANTRNPALWLAPYEGWGTLAGRFIDERGRRIHGAYLTLIPLEVSDGIEAPVRRQRTYAPGGPNPDEIWDENFAFADVPAGRYRLILSTANQIFRREVRVLPNQTNFVAIQADFSWSPTPVPTATPTPTPTLPPATGTPGAPRP